MNDLSDALLVGVMDEVLELLPEAILAPKVGVRDDGNLLPLADDGGNTDWLDALRQQVVLGCLGEPDADMIMLDVDPDTELLGLLDELEHLARWQVQSIAQEMEAGRPLAGQLDELLEVRGRLEEGLRLLVLRLDIRGVLLNLVHIFRGLLWFTHEARGRTESLPEEHGAEGRAGDLPPCRLGNRRHGFLVLRPWVATQDVLRSREMLSVPDHLVFILRLFGVPGEDCSDPVCPSHGHKKTRGMALIYAIPEGHPRGTSDGMPQFRFRAPHFSRRYTMTVTQVRNFPRPPPASSWRTRGRMSQ